MSRSAVPAIARGRRAHAYAATAPLASPPKRGVAGALAGQSTQPPEAVNLVGSKLFQGFTDAPRGVDRRDFARTTVEMMRLPGSEATTVAKSMVRPSRRSARQEPSGRPCAAMSGEANVGAFGRDLQADRTVRRGPALVERRSGASWPLVRAGRRPTRDGKLGVDQDMDRAGASSSKRRSPRTDTTHADSSPPHQHRRCRPPRCLKAEGRSGDRRGPASGRSGPAAPPRRRKHGRLSRGDTLVRSAPACGALSGAAMPVPNLRRFSRGGLVGGLQAPGGRRVEDYSPPVGEEGGVTPGKPGNSTRAMPSANRRIEKPAP